MTDNWKEVIDPEELFALKREGWEIEFKNTHEEKWFEWNGIEWESRWKFHAHPRQPKTKKVKLLCWIHKRTGAVFYGFTLITSDDGWIHQPHLDLEGRFEE